MYLYNRYIVYTCIRYLDYLIYSTINLKKKRKKNNKKKRKTSTATVAK